MGLCALALASSGAVTAPALRSWYPFLAKPDWVPPLWLLALFCGLIYPLAGVSAWLVWGRLDIGAERKRAALRLWLWQLLLSALWAPAFFGLRNPGLAVLVILLLLALVGRTILVFWRLHRLAALLLAPYIGGLCYTAGLNAGFWWLNGLRDMMTP